MTETVKVAEKNPERREDPDQELVARAQNGDTCAFDDLVIKYSRKLYGMVYSMTGNKEESNDLIQEIFSKAYISINNFKGKSTFYTWIYSIASNKTLNYLKKEKKKKTLSLEDFKIGVENDPAFQEYRKTADPRAQSDLKNLRERLNEALMCLSISHRAVVVLFDIQGVRHSEISKILKITEGTVRSRLHYAHKELQGLLGDLWNQ